jgi:hypothetical protein
MVQVQEAQSTRLCASMCKLQKSDNMMIIMLGMNGFIPSSNSLQQLFAPETIPCISLETCNYSSIHRKAPGKNLRKYPTSFQIIATNLTVPDYQDIEFSCKTIITES